MFEATIQPQPVPTVSAASVQDVQEAFGGVPLDRIVPQQLLFLCQLEDDPGQVSEGAFHFPAFLFCLLDSF